MSIPARPRFQPQNPAKSGYSLGWLSCTAYAMAMAIDKATLGKKAPTGADVRRKTGDTSGGLNLRQVATVATRDYGVPVEVRTPATVAYALGELRKGRGIVLQGNTSALLRTSYRSTGSAINHAVYVNEGRDWEQRQGLWTPREVLVYDPAADGRYTYDLAPSWWPVSVAKAFAAALRPWGDNTSTILGLGKMYAAFMPDTEPHAHFRYDGKRTDPFPDRARANVASGRRVNVRSRPALDAPIVDRIPDGTLFVAYQVTTTGASVSGSRKWYGDHDGRRWVHASGLRHTGGDT